MDLAKAAPTVPDCQAAAAAAPPARPAAYNTTLDHAPFETMEKYYPCPQAGISRSLMTGDVKGAQVYRTIRDPLDPMCLNKPYPGVWLEGIVDKSQKPSRTLQTNRQTSPLDPNYILPSGPSIMPSGEKKFSDRTFNMMLATDDICGAKPQPLYNKPCRCLHEGDPVEEIKGSKPKKWTWLRKLDYWGHNNDLWDIDIGKRHKGFVRERESNPLEPLYPTETVETHEMKYKRLKFVKLPPRKEKTDVGERLLDNMYWRAEKLYNMCWNWGQPQPTANTVTYDVLRYSLEKFGFYCTDKEFERIIQYADPFKIGSVRYLNFSRALRHCDGLELDIPRPLGFDVGYWGEPANLGQGGLVLEPVARYGRSTVLWSENEPVYSPLTGLPVSRNPNPRIPLDKETSGKALQKYNYSELKAKLDCDDRKQGQQQYQYFPSSSELPKEKKVPVLPIRQISLASSAEQIKRPSTCQPMNSRRLSALDLHKCEKPSDQSAKLAVIQTARELGAMVRNAPQVRERAYSKYPPLYTAMLPTNNQRGSQVLWKPQALFKPFVPSKVREQRYHRTQDIEAVKGLVNL
ncbi:unnamed protein product [Sphagnum jensenii]|uniref:Uncharacterized protein n=1 Tax=Sphagnum jensenii TaxID=128206 RepID=A0ABP0WWA4_9BRYO